MTALTAVRSHLWARWLGVLNRQSGRAVVDADGACDVSITSYGRRLGRVHVTIESIARGRRRPRTLTLVISADDHGRGLSPALRRLRRRGLEIRVAADLGPHTKYASASATSHPPRALVTADDDVIYPAPWLAELEEAHRRRPGAIVAHRAHRIIRDGEEIAPYAHWVAASRREPRADHLATGVGGVLYPHRARATIVAASSLVPQACRSADDIWLHYVTVRAGFLVAQVRSHPSNPLPVPGLGPAALVTGNVLGGGNDRAIRALWACEDLALIFARTQWIENPAKPPSLR